MYATDYKSRQAIKQIHLLNFTSTVMIFFYLTLRYKQLMNNWTPYMWLVSKGLSHQTNFLPETSQKNSWLKLAYLKREIPLSYRENQKH